MNTCLTFQFVTTTSLPSMALLSIRSDWYSYLWLLYVKIYSAIVRLVDNRCRRSADKTRSVISAVVGGQSPGGIHRARTHRRRRHSTTQHHIRVKHIVALTRRPSLRRIVMAPGASTAHTMMEDKEKTLNTVLGSGEWLTSPCCMACQWLAAFCLFSFIATRMANVFGRENDILLLFCFQHTL